MHDLILHHGDLGPVEASARARSVEFFLAEASGCDQSRNFKTRRGRTSF